MICMKRGKTWAVKEPINCSPQVFDQSLTTYASSSPVPQSLLGDGLSSSYPSPPAGTPRWVAVPKRVNLWLKDTVTLKLLSTLEPFTVHSARGHKIVTWAWDVQWRPKTCCNREPLHLLSSFVHFPHQRSSLRRLSSKTRVGCHTFNRLIALEVASCCHSLPSPWFRQNNDQKHIYFFLISPDSSRYTT